MLQPVTEDLQIYQYNYADIIHEKQCVDVLSPDEIVRAKAFVFDTDRDWFIACRVVLRKHLAKVLACQPQEVCFQYSIDGKPLLSRKHQTRLQFNLSHTKDKLLLALHAYKPIGIDLEKFQDKDNLGIVQRFFHQDEINIFNHIVKEKQADAFYRLWVIKEAIAKAQGIGLFQIISKVAVQGFVEGTNIFVPEMPDIEINLLSMPKNYYAAVCLFSD